MYRPQSITLETPLGKRELDHSGSPLGIVRMDVGKSYSGIGELLQKFIDSSEQEIWERIKGKINYTYEQIDFALTPLEAETAFAKEIQSRIGKGLKLLFKPNLVNPSCIDPQTHGPDIGSTACTEWSFLAALMRWFHDKLDIGYHQMAVGEAATCMSSAAGYYSQINPGKNRITTEAVIEGKIGDFYCGWGFYFARRYLAESLGSDRSDDPMKGYAESVSGIYIPPGEVLDKLMVYDLNRIFDDPNKGREIEVPGGINFKSITLHKVVVGGSPDAPKDLQAYPGCILVNVPKFKGHAITLFTNAIKNLGIGLYPMQSAKTGGFKWDYSVPFSAIPGMKGKIPHHVWVADMDTENGIPKRDQGGEYVVSKTGGINATMIDIIKAVKNQGIFMIHIVDGVETINQDHTSSILGKKEPEGMVFAGLDPVALDVMCARYMFSNVPLKEAMDADLLHNSSSPPFPQRVPLPMLDGNNIITRIGYDYPLSRDKSFEEAEKRELGSRNYHVIGKDAVTDCPLVSFQGHLGTITDGAFSDLVTKVLYFDVYKIPWDLQQTAFHYFIAADKLSSSSLKEEFLDAFDKDGDGVVTYEDFGKKGYVDFFLHSGGESVADMGSSPLGYLRGTFIQRTKVLKTALSRWNSEGHHIFKEVLSGAACFMAYRMSQMGIESQDPFVPGLVWGKGKWPSFKLAWYIYLGVNLYGPQFPFKISFPGLYGSAFRYADLIQNDGRYAGKIRNQPNPEALSKYASEIKSGQIAPLNFTFYLPAEYENVGGVKVPNVEGTADPARVFTAVFADGKEIWKGI